MIDGNKKKSEQLGMPIGTASSRLRKLVLFDMLRRHCENICFQCGKEIEKPDELSIEHKVPWLDNDPSLFWDLSNIAFSHFHCNVSFARRNGHEPYPANAKELYCRDCGKFLPKSEFYPPPKRVGRLCKHHHIVRSVESRRKRRSPNIG